MGSEEENQKITDCLYTLVNVSLKVLLFSYVSIDQR